jgi:N-acetylneuraminic acid mutarotase
MHVARDGHTATLLTNGTVLASGGEGSNGVTTSTEIYNPSTGSWSATGNLNVARASYDAVLLPSGKILVAGGCIKTCVSGNTATAELFDPTSGVWSKTGSMKTARVYFGMVLLSNGKVLAVGGCTGQNSNGCTGVTSAAEIYNPATGTWSATNAMRAARGAFTATLLPKGLVLVAGGINAAGNPINSAERYDSGSGTWAGTGSLNVARDEHTATLLSNGQVLVAGGENTSGVTFGQTELYNPTTKKWTLTGNMNNGRLEHAAVLLANGKVLVSGGNKVTATATTVLPSAEIYDPTTGVWSKTGNMSGPRVGHSSTLLGSGLVLNAGGNDGTKELATSEAYKP